MADTKELGGLLPARAARAQSALGEALDAAAAVDLAWLDGPLRDDGWELAPDALRLLVALVRSLRPRHVVEFGSGRSTVVLARAAEEVGHCSITSFDHDPVFAAGTRDALGDQSFGDLVDLRVAPLVARGRAGLLCPQYLVDAEVPARKPAADLLLVDGPPAVLGGRVGMLYQALDFAQCGSVILFDDAGRAAEADALERWRRTLGDAVTLDCPAGFAKGLAVAVVVAPATAHIRIEHVARSGEW
jgi:predicted O-methyltransferase YrrM